MRFEQLTYLDEISKTGTISGAAKNLYVSQQAISSSMKQLEEELGVELFIRSASGVTFTAVGREVAEFAKQTMKHKNLLLHRIRYWQENQTIGEELHLRIMSMSCVLNDVIPGVLSHLEGLHAKATMQVSLLNDSHDVMAQVQQKQCDFGLVTLNEDMLQERCAAYGLELELIARDEIVVVAEQRIVNIEKNVFEGVEFALHPQSIFNIDIQEHYRNQEMRGVSSSNDINFHKKMMHERDAYVIMPNIASKKFFSKGKYKTLFFQDEAIPIVHAAVFLPGCSPQIREIISLIRQEMLS